MILCDLFSFSLVADSAILMCLHQGNICVLLQVISWLCRYIDWVPTDVGPSLLPDRRRGTLYRNSCVILSTPPLCLHAYWRHFFSQSTSIHSALRAVSFGIDALYKLTFYLLTYLRQNRNSKDMSLGFLSSAWKRPYSITKDDSRK